MTTPDIVQVRLLGNLRSTYGATMHVGYDKALRGHERGIWQIVDPKIIEAELNKERGLEEDPGLDIDRTVSIVIVVLDNVEYTDRCIASIRKYTDEEDRPLQLIVVDNGSTDGSMIRIGKLLTGKEDVLVRNNRNKGFSKGNNQGLRHATGRYTLLLNNDTEVKAKRWLEPLIKAVDDGTHLVGPTLRRLGVVDGQFVFGGDGSPRDEWCYVEGWCLFAKTEILKKLGGFDERFSPAYSEDADLSFTIKDKGMKIGKVPVPVVHFVSKTSSALGKDRGGISDRNRAKLYLKWVLKDKRHILLKRHGAIGDVLMCTPIIQELRKQNPTAEIVLETACPQLIEGNPYLSEIVSKATSKDFTDTFILDYEARPGEHLIDAMAKQAGIGKLKDRRMEVFLKDSSFKCPVKSPYVVMHTGRTWPNKEWPQDRFETVAGWLKGADYAIVQIGDARSQRLSAADHMMTSAPWAKITELMRGSAFFLGIDSAPANLAKAVGIPAWIIYGCVDPELYTTGADEHPISVDRRTLPCFGCRNRSSETYVPCTQPEPYCLTRIEVEDVIYRLDKWMKKTANTKKQGKEPWRSIALKTISTRL